MLSDTLKLGLDTDFKGKSELPRPEFCVPEHGKPSCHRLLSSYPWAM